MGCMTNLLNNGTVAVILYGVCSTTMAFLNKAVISSYDFGFPFFIMACQMIVSVVFLQIMIKVDKIHIPPLTLKAAKSFFLASTSYGLHATLSLIALKGMNIPMYTALKRCTPVVNLVFSVVILGKPMPSIPIVVSICTITLGCIVAVYGDLTFDLFTYTVGVLSVMAQGIYLTLVEKVTENNYSTLEIFQFNSYNTLGPFIVASIVFREPGRIVTTPHLHNPDFQFLFALLVVMGVMLNYSLFHCTFVTSALTTSLVGVAKSSLQILVGFFVFEGVQYDPWNVFGISLNFAGGIVYTYIKYRESTKHVFEATSRDYNNIAKPTSKADLGVTPRIHQREPLV